MSDLISVIIPVYKVEECIKRCVRSITTQTYKNLEILLVDDGSPDGSGKICDNLAVEDSRIKVIHTKNGGAAKARNIGLDNASGDYIGFVDSDDYIEPDMYELLLKSLKENKTDISCVGIIREDGEGKNKHVIRCAPKKTIYNDEDVFREILLLRNVGSSLYTKLYTRQCWDSIRLVEGEINEDMKIMFELYSRKTMVHIGKPMYHYIINPKSVTHNCSYDDLTVNFNNALYFVEETKRKYPKNMDAALYYLTDVAKSVLMQDDNIVSSDTLLYKKCREIFNENYRLLGFDWRSILIKINLYHKLKKFLKG